MGKLGMEMAKFQGISWRKIHRIDGAVPKNSQENSNETENLGILLKSLNPEGFSWLVFPGIPLQVVPFGGIFLIPAFFFQG